jgi:cystathionine beta-synthase
MPFQNVLAAIGNTPVVKVTNIDTGPCELYLKLENHNPGGSIKDRIALSMIHQAEQEGLLKPGGEIVEATAGNTGLGLALVAGLKGYRLTLVIPDKMSAEKIQHLKAMGVRIIITRSDVEQGHPEYYQDLARRIAQERNAYFIDQFNNPANPEAHYQTTGPEIWEQMHQQLDYIVLGVGSSGTLAGLTRFFNDVHPSLKFILADPQGSILADYVNTGKIPDQVGSWVVEGIGEDFIPSIADFSKVEKGFSITDRESFETARTLLMKEGILAGSSSGTLLCAALRFCREQTSPKKVLSFVCDSGNKYLTKVYNDLWMKDHGLLTREPKGDLRDIIFRGYQEREIISIKPEDTLQMAFLKMKNNDISQLPVMDDRRVVGLVDESDLLLSITGNPDLFSQKVYEVMSKNLVSIYPDQPEEDLLNILKKDFVAIVESRNGEFYGMITKIDYLTYLKYYKNF